MGTKNRRDLVRQGANVAGALFQVVVPILTGPAIGQVSDENRSLVVPAGYAFAIWNLIFLLCFAYAIYQALPANRDNPLLRQVGWFFAAAFFLDGVWEIMFPTRQFVLAQIVIASTFACLAVVYLRLAREAYGLVSSGTERWLVFLPLGLFFGWVTAATFVSFATTAVALGLLGGGIGETLVGTTLLLLGGLFASAVVLYGKASPGPTFYLPYAASVLWALVAIIANQYDTSGLTTGAAVISAALVVLALFRTWRRGQPGGGTGRIARSEAT